MVILKDYQNKAVESLTIKIQSALENNNNELIVFQSPTGSGKTVMVSETLRRVVKNNTDKYSFIWISVRHLHEQSKEKLEKYYEDDNLIQCSYFDDLTDKIIGDSEILFLNWHSINKKDINIYIKDNEQDNTLNKIVENTKEDGRKIVLIIDESHHTAKSEKSKELIAAISPGLVIEVSATPKNKDMATQIEYVRLEDVKEEEMIKYEVAINPEFNEVKIGKQDTDTLVIDQALKKRESLKEQFKTEGKDINPLVLIQLPDHKNTLPNKKDEVLKILKERFEVTEESGKLAIWLSEDKTDNLANIEKNNDKVEVLVFKQAIALGWDCPRAQILVIFRESKSFIFTIQTIGRIMRMPELKYYPYHEELNKGYIFTNLDNVEITEDYAKDYISVFESKRVNSKYNSISLQSIYLKRMRERNRLSRDFVKIFMDVAKNKKLANKISKNPSALVSTIMSNGLIENIDKVGKVTSGSKIDINLGSSEIQKLFDKFIFDNCYPYAPADSSDRMKTAIYKFLASECGIKKYEQQAQVVVLGTENMQFFVDIINISKEKYYEKNQKINEKREKIENINWEVPQIISYNSTYNSEVYAKSIMYPCYVKNPSSPEKKFMEAIDNSKKVNWWFKNGENEIKYFAICYNDDNGVERAFYVDFIVMFANKTIGLFDTKSGFTAKDATSKAKGLWNYIETYKHRNLWGGIVIESGGSWRYNNNENYKYNPNNLSDWKILEL